MAYIPPRIAIYSLMIGCVIVKQVKISDMKISELIKKLQELKKEHGDIEVMAYTDADCHGYYDTFIEDNVCYDKSDNVILIL